MLPWLWWLVWSNYMTQVWLIRASEQFSWHLCWNNLEWGSFLWGGWARGNGRLVLWSPSQSWFGNSLPNTEASAKERTKIQNRFPMSSFQLLNPAIPNLLDFSVTWIYKFLFLGASVITSWGSVPNNEICHSTWTGLHLSILYFGIQFWKFVWSKDSVTKKSD